MPLSTAVAAAGRGEWPAALSALLEAWRAARTPELAELIERVSARAAGPPIGGGGSMTSATRKRIAAAGDGDVGPILEAALRQMRTFPRAYKFVVELAGRRPPDPRIAAALAQIVAAPPFVDRAGALYDDVVRALDAIDDPRYRPMLLDAWRVLEPIRGRIRKYRAALDVLEDIARAIPARPPAPPRPEIEVVEAIAEIDAALARVEPRQHKQASDAGELLAAIRANPADLALRLVYADALLERSDPRGELIALQCGRGDAPPGKRERALLATYGRAWLGEIEPVVLKQGVVYRRGFLACAREGLKRIPHYALLRSPEWTTIEELDVSVWGEHAVEFVSDPRWRVLDRVFGLYAPDLPALASLDRQMPWRSLGVRHPGAETLRLIARVCPSLVELDLSPNGDAAVLLGALAQSPLAGRLRRVRVRARMAIDPLVELARRAGVAELELVPDYLFPSLPAFEAVRLAGNHATLIQRAGKIDPRYAASILGQLAPGRIRSVALDAVDGARVDDAAWLVLQRALDTHGVTLAKPGPGVIVAG